MYLSEGFKDLGTSTIKMFQVLVVVQVFEKRTWVQLPSTQ